MHYFVQGLRDDIKREVLMHKPVDYRTAENLARLKVSVDRTINEKSKDPEKGILYKCISSWTSWIQNVLNQQVTRSQKMQPSNLLTDPSPICLRKIGSCAMKCRL